MNAHKKFHGRKYSWKRYRDGELESWVQKVPVDKHIRKVKANELGEDILLSPSELMDCYLGALRRMAVVLNQSNKHSEFFKKDILKRNDDEIAQVFESENLWGKYCALNRLELDRNLTRQEIADEFFYASFSFETGTHGIRQLRNRLPESFFLLLYEGQHLPLGTPNELGVKDIDRGLLKNSTINYLLRNFWHNFIHTHYQKITHANYQQFSGQARFDSDFEADNISYFLLAKSYSLRVSTSGFKDERPDKKLVHLRRQNRCNRVFVVREQVRNKELRTKQDKYSLFENHEWRRRRSMGGAISGYMLERGRAVCSLGTNFLGPVKEGEKGRFDRDITRVLAQVNGVRVSCPCRSPKPGWDEEDNRNFIDNMSARIYDEYVDHVRDDETIRQWAAESLSSLFHRLGIE